MVVPRVDPRIYGLFLFILLLIVVALEEIIPNKKYLFLALIPIFCYQVIIIWDYAELPLPPWLDWFRLSNHSHDNEETQPAGTSKCKVADKYVIPTISTKDKETTPDVSSSREKQSFETTHDQKTYSRQNSTKSILSDEANISPTDSQYSEACQSQQKSPNSLEPSSTTEFVIGEKRSSLKGRHDMAKRSFDCKLNERAKPNRSVTFCEKPTFPNAHRSEYTKSYYFPHRLKRLQSCLEAPTANARQYKVRHYSEKDSERHLNLPTPSTSSEGSEEAFDCSENQNKLPDDFEHDKNDLTKSYSFPLRQRKQDRWTESTSELDDEFNLPAMPLWDYCPSNLGGKRRKSISTDALHRGLQLMDSPFQQKENDFCQSLELPREENSSNNLAGKNARPLSNFNKIKQGIVNRFNKSKRVDSCKQNTQNRKTFFKELFSSKENVNLGSAKKLSKSSSSYVPSKLMKKEHSPSQFSPTYVSYGNFNSYCKAIDDFTIEP